MNFGFTLWFALLGLIVGRAPGALAGAVIGFVLDNLRYSQRRRATPAAGGFVGPLFAVLGAVAKADGRVSEAEIAVAERLMTRMGLGADQRQQAVASFNAGKQPGYDIAGALDALRDWAGVRRDHAFPVLDVVIETVLTDGQPAPEKMAILRRLAQALRVSDMELMALLAMKGYAWNTGTQGRAYRPGWNGSASGHNHVPPRRSDTGPDPYAVLGVDPGADQRTIKRAYRKLISEHHPDRLGDLPEDMRRRAEARASEINAAYDRVKELRGW